MRPSPMMFTGRWMEIGVAAFRAVKTLLWKTKKSSWLADDQELMCALPS